MKILTANNLVAINVYIEFAYLRLNEKTTNFVFRNEKFK
jgi:hypothetical protein